MDGAGDFDTCAIYSKICLANGALRNMGRVETELWWGWSAVGDGWFGEGDFPAIISTPKLEGEFGDIFFEQGLDHNVFASIVIELEILIRKVDRCVESWG